MKALNARWLVVVATLLGALAGCGVGYQPPAAKPVGTAKQALGGPCTKNGPYPCCDTPDEPTATYQCCWVHCKGTNFSFSDGEYCNCNRSSDDDESGGGAYGEQ